MPPNDRIEIQRVANGWIISPVRVSYMDPARSGEIHVATTPEQVLEAVQAFLLTEITLRADALDEKAEHAFLTSLTGTTPTHTLEAPR